MLSRLSIRAVQETKPNLLLARISSSTVQSSEVRNEVDFPRPKRAIYPGKVRMGFLPEEWFQFFYPKTGVTGPYAFGISFLTYLCSKEIFVMEHEYFTGLTLGIMAVYAIKKFGPGVAAALDKEVDSFESGYNSIRDDSIANLNEAIKEEKDAQWRAQGQTLLFDAKRENIGLQLEGVYRQRLIEIHSQVKKKLDYQLETTNVKTRLEQRHMVNWIVDNVRKSISPAQETAALNQCLSDLKGLAAAAKA